MIRLLAFLLTFPALFHATAKEPSLRIITVVGTGGTDTYEKIFIESAERWKKAADLGGAEFTLIGVGEEEPETSDHDLFQDAVKTATEPELWIVLIGHGSFDSRTVKFNLRGPDFTDKDLADWLKPYPGDLAVINTASSSGSFIRTLSGPNRTIITATKNEAEVFYTRFGDYFSTAISGIKDADLDNDNQVSLLESFLYASHETAKFYEDAGRLATEHAMIDDNGDTLGSRMEWFDGTTATQMAAKEAKPDGDLSAQKVLVRNEFERRLSPEQRTERDQLERAVKTLRRQKNSLDEDTYYGQLEPLLLKLAQLYREVGDS
ncbi:MAG: hypothetical protein P1U58_06160 [Verrucomicrobiales bacterium]|nr:hypothetical protein [Verrucomicrobiales bacterium]